MTDLPNNPAFPFESNPGIDAIEPPQLASHVRHGLTSVEHQFDYYEQMMSGLDAAKVLLSHYPEFGPLMPVISEKIDNDIDRTAQKLNTAEERYGATHDKLTGLLNRAGLENALAGIRDDKPRVFLFADATNFKRVNDTFDHIVGDGMLREISAVLRTSLRLEEDDILARIGGDEFVAILQTESTGNNRRKGEATPEEQVQAVSERVESTMDEMLSLYPHIRDVGFHLSVGGVVMRSGDHIDDLKRSAEANMHEHKARQHEKLGKNRP